MLLRSDIFRRTPVSTWHDADAGAAARRDPWLERRTRPASVKKKKKKKKRGLVQSWRRRRREEEERLVRQKKERRKSCDMTFQLLCWIKERKKKELCHDFSTSLLDYVYWKDIIEFFIVLLKEDRWHLKNKTKTLTHFKFFKFCHKKKQKDPHIFF